MSALESINTPESLQSGAIMGAIIRVLEDKSRLDVEIRLVGHHTVRQVGVLILHTMPNSRFLHHYHFFFSNYISRRKGNIPFP